MVTDSTGTTLYAYATIYVPQRDGRERNNNNNMRVDALRLATTSGFFLMFFCNKIRSYCDAAYTITYSDDVYIHA